MKYFNEKREGEGEGRGRRKEGGRRREEEEEMSGLTFGSGRLHSDLLDAIK